MINDIEGQLTHVLSENMNLHRKIDGMQERVDNLRYVKAEMEGERYDKDKRIAELEKGLELAQQILRSAYKQQWAGAYNALEICTSLLKEQGE